MNQCWLIVHWTLWNKLQWNSFTQMRLEKSSAKWRSFCPGGDELNHASKGATDVNPRVFAICDMVMSGLFTLLYHDSHFAEANSEWQIYPILTCLNSFKVLVWLCETHSHHDDAEFRRNDPSLLAIVTSYVHNKISRIHQHVKFQAIPPMCFEENARKPQI